MNSEWGGGLKGAAWVIAFVLVGLAPGVALADVNGYVSTGTSYDDNIFLLPRGVTPPGASRDDIGSNLFGGGTLDLQNDHLQLNASADVGQHWYSRNAFLNSLAYDGRVELSERQKFFSLDLQAQQTQALSSFEDIRAAVRNLQSLTRTGARVGLAVTSDVRLVFDGKFNRNTNSATQFSRADYNQSGFGAGVGYFSPSGNSVVVERLRSFTGGIRPQTVLAGNALISSRVNYIDDTTNIQLSYAPSSVVGLFAQGGYLQRTDLSVLKANTSSPVGLLRLSYSPDTALNFALSAGHQLSSQSYMLISGVKDSYIKAGPTFTLSGGLSLSYRFTYDRRKYGYLPQFGFANSNTGDQSFRSDAAISYKCLDRYEIDFGAFHEERRSNAVSDTFRGNGVFLTLTIRTARPSAPPAQLDQADYLLLP